MKTNANTIEDNLSYLRETAAKNEWCIYTEQQLRTQVGQKYKECGPSWGAKRSLILTEVEELIATLQPQERFVYIRVPASEEVWAALDIIKIFPGTVICDGDSGSVCNYSGLDEVRCKKVLVRAPRAQTLRDR